MPPKKNLGRWEWMHYKNCPLYIHTSRTRKGTSTSNIDWKRVTASTPEQNLWKVTAWEQSPRMKPSQPLGLTHQHYLTTFQATHQYSMSFKGIEVDVQVLSSLRHS